MQPRSVTRNAADPKQVKTAERIVRMRDERMARALAAVIDTPEGRTVFAELIRRAKVHESIWHPSAEIHYNAGRQDYGHELMAMLADLSLDHYLLMQKEEWEWLKQQQRTIDAAHAGRAERADS